MIIGLVCLFVAFILVAYAASCNAKMDTVTHHFDTSIYKYKDPLWHYPLVSCEIDYILWIQLSSRYLPGWVFWISTEIISRKKIVDPVADFWHWEKTKMLLSIIASGLFSLVGGLFIENDIWGVLASIALAYYCGAGVIWNLVFNYYYNKKLRRL